MTDQTHLAWPFFDDRHRKYAGDIAAWANANGKLLAHTDDEFAACRRIVAALGEAGWLAHTVPARGGGPSERLDVRTLCLARETLAWHSGLADFAFAMQGLGSGPISLFGSDALVKKYLPEVKAGRCVAAFALSEVDAGSDVAAIATTARRDGNGFVIDGEKTWISNAGIADFYVVFARSGEAPGRDGLSVFVVDADTAGLKVTETIPVTSPHPLGTLRFDGCRVPASQRIGDGGAGFTIAMGTLDMFRSTVGAAAVGFARRALDEALRRVRSRRVFDSSLADLQLTQDKIADMATEIDTSALLVYRAAWTKDMGAERVTREAAMAKFYATETAQRVIDRAVQLFGGLGVVRGGVVEALYRDIRPLRIYEGTSEIQKLIVAREVLKKAGK